MMIPWIFLLQLPPFSTKPNDNQVDPTNMQPPTNPCHKFVTPKPMQEGSYAHVNASVIQSKTNVQNTSVSGLDSPILT